MAVGAFLGDARQRDMGFSDHVCVRCQGSLQLSNEEEMEIEIELDEELQEILGEDVVVIFKPAKEIKRFIVDDESDQIH